MTVTTDKDLYARGVATLLASWEEYARGSAGAALERRPGVSAAVFPTDPERGVYNNALLHRDLAPAGRAAAVDAMEAAYRSAGIDRYAAWAHESDEAMRSELGRRGYTFAEATRAMGMSLDEVPPALGDREIGTLDWPGYLGYLRMFGLPDGLLAGADPGAFRVVAARAAGEVVATAVAFDHDSDCGVVSVSTLETGRRRGLATALTARQVRDAVERGCSTASVQSTAMAEGVYASVGFRASAGTSSTCRRRAGALRPRRCARGSRPPASPRTAAARRCRGRPGRRRTGSP
jgi:GNAT superfamily N-acetyltransferase